MKVDEEVMSVKDGRIDSSKINDCTVPSFVLLSSFLDNDDQVSCTQSLRRIPGAKVTLNDV